MDKEGKKLNVISALPYVKVERRITCMGQETVVHDRKLYLYRTKIVSYSREFPINEVYDMSFKKVGKEEGIFYLHTKQGVYPYHINTDPAHFIGEFKKAVKG